MQMPVLHIRGDELPAHLFTDAFLSDGSGLIIHVDNVEVRQTDVHTWVRDGLTGKVRHSVSVAPYPHGCGCP